MASYVQSNSEYYSDGVVAFGSNVVSGNFLVCVIDSDTNLGGGVSISDSIGNTWSVASEQYQFTSSTNVFIGVYYAFSNSSAANTVTASGLSGVVGMAIYEFSGIATSGTVDVVGSSSAPSGTTLYANSITTNYTDMFLFVWADRHTGNGYTAGTNYTLGQTQNFGACINAQQYRFGVTSGTYASEFITLSVDPGGTDAVWVIAFKEASGSTPTAGLMGYF